jgi:DNA repair protein RecO (recombination protein O)
MEWQEPAAILEVVPLGEGDAVATLLTAGRGLWRGLVKGGKARGKTALWQKGNLITARWKARHAENLGHLSGEMAYPAAALALSDRLAVAVLNAACALAAGALPEREPHPDAFAGLARLLAALGTDQLALPTLITWELELLRELGFGLDLTASAIAGDNEPPCFVSPRTGRAVSRVAAGVWASRLLELPPFLLGEGEPGPGDCLAGLKLTGHFLARDVFGARHQPLPPARERLYDLLLEETRH